METVHLFPHTTDFTDQMIFKLYTTHSVSLHTYKHYTSSQTGKKKLWKRRVALFAALCFCVSVWTPPEAGAPAGTKGRKHLHSPPPAGAQTQPPTPRTYFSPLGGLRGSLLARLNHWFSIWQTSSKKATKGSATVYNPLSSQLRFVFERRKSVPSDHDLNMNVTSRAFVISGLSIYST